MFDGPQNAPHNAAETHPKVWAGPISRAHSLSPNNPYLRIYADMFVKHAKTIRHIANNTLTQTGKVLLAIFDWYDDVLFAKAHQSLTYRMSVKEARAYLEEIEEYRRRAILRRMKQNGWIEEKKINDKVIWKLTKDGRIAALQLIIARTTEMLTDKKKVIVTFDFPIRANTSRDHFRRTLERSGFSFSQRSVWVTNKDVRHDLTHLIGRLKIKRWVKIFEAKEIPLK